MDEKKVIVTAGVTSQERVDRNTSVQTGVDSVTRTSTPHWSSPPLSTHQSTAPQQAVIESAPMTLGAGATLDLIWVFAGAAFIGMALLVWGYTSAPDPKLGANEAIPALAFYTLGAGVLIMLVQFGFFLRSRRNRAATERVLTD